MNKILLITLVAVAFVAIEAETGGKLQPRGAPRQLEGEGLKEAEETLELSLKKLAAGEDAINYKLSKIHSASKQTVSGTLYKINADIIDGEETKNCDVSIWSRAWLENGIEVDFNCKDGKKFKRNHSA
ncbi:sarcocystatin-A [Musca domestica]|uniref:Sarcocystatin-A n=1 Tax=Musca domestica TaxID=7370 RepID=A0A1I8MGU4_MUSDO|nr:sarcocystatin-A [Musca domestica]